jgi:hypothetical protein
MKNRLRILTVVLLVVLAAIGLTACGGTVEDEVNSNIASVVLQKNGAEVTELALGKDFNAGEFSLFITYKDGSTDTVTLEEVMITEMPNLTMEGRQTIKIKYANKEYTYSIVVAAQTIAAYTVVFKDYDGTELKTQTVTYGDAATAPNAPTREGYRFTGWDKVFANITANTDITAQYIKTWAVRFLDYDGTVLDTQTVDQGGAATAPNAPTRTGYRFIGWDKAFNNVTQNLDVNAEYETAVPNDGFDSAIPLSLVPVAGAETNGSAYYKLDNAAGNSGLVYAYLKFRNTDLDALDGLTPFGMYIYGANKTELNYNGLNFYSFSDATHTYRALIFNGSETCYYIRLVNVLTAYEAVGAAAPEFTPLSLGQTATKISDGVAPVFFSFNATAPGNYIYTVGGVSGADIGIYDSGCPIILTSSLTGVTSMLNLHVGGSGTYFFSVLAPAGSFTVTVTEDTEMDDVLAKAEMLVINTETAFTTAHDGMINGVAVKYYPFVFKPESNGSYLFDVEFAGGLSTEVAIGMIFTSTLELVEFTNFPVFLEGGTKYYIVMYSVGSQSVSGTVTASGLYVIDDPITLKLGEEFSGSVFGTMTLYFQLSLEEDGEYEFSAAQLDGYNQITVSVYGSNGVTLLYTKTQMTTISARWALQAGDYVVTFRTAKQGAAIPITLLAEVAAPVVPDGESFATAYPLTLGENHTPNGFKDTYFVFVPAESGSYIFTSAGTDDSDPDGYLYNVSKASIEYDYDTNGKQFEISFYLVAGQTYYLKAIAYSKQGSYTVKVEKSAEEVGDGDAFETAHPMTLGDDCSPNGFKDTYFVFVPAESGVYAFASAGTDGSDPVGYLYDVNKVQIASNDDINSGRQFRIKYELVAGEIYYLKTVAYSKQGSYTVSVKVFEPDGESFGTAYRMILGESYRTNADADTYFVFIPKVSGEYSFTSSSNGGSDPQGYLYSAQFVELASDDQSAGGDNFKITYTLTAFATYYLKASFWSMFKEGQYTVSVDNSTNTYYYQEPIIVAQNTAAGILENAVAEMFVHYGVTVTADDYGDVLISIGGGYCATAADVLLALANGDMLLSEYQEMTATFDGVAVVFDLYCYVSTVDRSYTFVTNGGSEVASVTAVHLERIPITTQAGLYFAGWYDNAALSGTPVAFPYYSTDNTVLYAAWSATMTEELFWSWLLLADGFTIDSEESDTFVFTMELYGNNMRVSTGKSGPAFSMIMYYDMETGKVFEVADDGTLSLMGGNITRNGGNTLAQLYALNFALDYAAGGTLEFNETDNGLEAVFTLDSEGNQVLYKIYNIGNTTVNLPTGA